MEINKSKTSFLCDQHNYNNASVKIEISEKLDEMINNDHDSFTVPIITDIYTLNPCPDKTPLVKPNSAKEVTNTTPCRRSKRLEQQKLSNKKKKQDESQSLSSVKKINKDIKTVATLAIKTKLNRSNFQEERIKRLYKELAKKEEIILAQRKEIKTIGIQLTYIFEVAENLENHIKSLNDEKEKLKSELRRAYQKFLDNRALKHPSHHSPQARKELAMKSEIDNVEDTIIYTCIYCKKNFNSENNLILHIRSHSSERPFSCKLCNNRYKYKINLYNHHLRKHVKSQ